MVWPFRITPPLLHTLAVLIDTGRPLHGWEIARSAAEPPANVYRVLQRLHSVGWVSREWADEDESPGRPRRRLYQLTEAGREAGPRLLSERGDTRAIGEIRRDD